VLNELVTPDVLHKRSSVEGDREVGQDPDNRWREGRGARVTSGKGEGWNRPKRGLLACWEEGGFFYFLSQDFSSEDNTKTKSKSETKRKCFQPMSAQNYLEVFF